MGCQPSAQHSVVSPILTSEFYIVYLVLFHFCNLNFTGYATIFRGSGVFHRGTAANYERVIYVKTMEFKDVTILNKTDALFSTQYSDPVDMLSQHLVGKLNRLLEQVEYVRDHPEKVSHSQTTYNSG